MEQLTEKEKKLLEYYYKKQKKKKAIIMGVVIGIAVILISFLGYSIYSQSQWNVRQDTITIEYGTPYEPNVAALVDTNKYSFITFERTRISGILVNEKEKSYPAVGNYELIINYSGNINILGISIPVRSQKSVEVVVKDTTSPTVTPPDKIEILVGTKFDMKDYLYLFKVNDYSETKDMVYDTSNVNTSVVGTYMVDAMVEDIYGNQTEFQIPISVINDPYEEEIPEETTKETTPQETSSVSDSSTQTSSKKEENTTQASVKNENKQQSDKTYSNKDFLFSDGYTMSTVSDAAYNYLKSTGKSGECIPLQDDEGIYIGMRVIIYN